MNRSAVAPPVFRSAEDPRPDVASVGGDRSWPLARNATTCNWEIVRAFRAHSACQSNVLGLFGLSARYESRHDEKTARIERDALSKADEALSGLPRERLGLRVAHAEGYGTRRLRTYREALPVQSRSARLLARRLAR